MIEDAKSSRPRGSWPGPPPGGLALDELSRELPMRADLVGDASVRVRGVRHDSRAVEPGDLFVARRGEKVDGARFVEDAMERGATAVMAAHGALDAQKSRVPVLFVDDPAAAIGFAASAVYGHPSFSLEVVGITGTNGKTTTAHLARAAIDGALGATLCGVLGTVGHRFGAWSVPAGHTTPEADDIARTMAEMRALGATHVAMEVSSHALALGRLRGVHVRVAALTNLTQDHLDFHGSMQAYAETKERLFTDARSGRGRPERGRRVRARAGRARQGPARAGQRADRRRRGRRDRASRRAPRRRGHAGDRPHAERRRDPRVAPRRGAQPRQPAARAGHRARPRPRSRCERPTLFRASQARPAGFERCDGDGDDVIVLVDYAHTPDALARALDAIRAVTAGRVWCVFGCGGDRDPTKRAPMGEAAARRADVTVVTTTIRAPRMPDAIAAQIVAGVRAAGATPVVELDRRKAIDLAVRSASAGTPS